MLESKTSDEIKRKEVRGKKGWWTEIRSVFEQPMPECHTVPYPHNRVQKTVVLQLTASTAVTTMVCRS